MRRRITSPVLAALLLLGAGAAAGGDPNTPPVQVAGAPVTPMALSAPCDPFTPDPLPGMEASLPSVGSGAAASAAAAPAAAVAAAFAPPTGLAPKKKAWEAELGSKALVRARIHARLAGWPAQLVVGATDLPADDRAFLERVARDTWHGLDALRDRASGLPVDHVRFSGSPLDLGSAEIGDYASISSVGLSLASIVAAREIGLVTADDALARVRQILATLRRLETYRGIFFNFYDTTSLERTSQFLSFVDSAWLTAGLMVVRSAFPELRDEATVLIQQRSYSFFYDAGQHQMSHGYYVDREQRSPYHYATLYTEARLGSLIAIGKGDVPEDHWYRMARTFPAGCTWQTQLPKDRHAKQVNGFLVTGGYYEWKGLRFVPSWGGSMFEALMPTLFLDERALAPRSLGRNDEVHVELQRRFATEDLGFPVWGMSPAASPQPTGYHEYGAKPLGVHGYEEVAVTPHAAALALQFAPEQATAALRRLATLYPIYGEYGFYDSVDPRTGAVATAYLALDQNMLFLALANQLSGGVIQKRFAEDPIAQAALQLLGDEDFFD